MGMGWAPAREILDSLEDRLALHEHALATAKGGIVHRIVTVVRPIPEVIGLEVEDMPSAGTPQYGLVDIGVKDLGNHRQRLKHHEAFTSTSPLGSRTSHLPCSSCPMTMSPTTGTSTSP